MWKLTKKVLRNKTIRITFSDNGVVKTLILLGYESIWIFKELVVFCYIPPPPHILGLNISKNRFLRLHPGAGATKRLRNNGNYLPVNTASFLSRLRSSIHQTFLLKINTVGDRRPARSRK